MRRSTKLALVSVLSFAACTGLYFDKGNTYPCTFAQGPGARDAVCVPGDVCGSDNLCHPYIYEGPRFEGNATIPTFEASEFVRLHPGSLDGPITQLAGPADSKGSLFIQLGDGGVILRSPLGSLRHSPFAVDLGLFEDAYAGSIDLGNVGAVDGVIGVTAGKLAYSVYLPARDAGAENATGDGVARLRFLPNLEAPFFGFYAVTALPGPVAAGVRAKPVTRELETVPLALDAGTTWDVALLRVDQHDALVVAARDALWLQKQDGGFEVVLDRAPALTRTQLRVNAAGTLLIEQHPSQLSVFTVGVRAGAFELTPAWPTCTPCGRELLVAAVPRPPQDGVGVEVVCQPLSGIGVRLLVVTGSAGGGPGQQCLSEELPLPLDPAKVSKGEGPFVQSASQRFLTIGGQHGELWEGNSFSSLQPFALDRVPLDVFPIDYDTPEGRSSVLGAITDRYLAAQDISDSALPRGFVRLDSRGVFSSPVAVRLLASIRGVSCWALQPSGVLLRAQLSTIPDGGAQVLFGRKLTTAAGDPIRSSSGGEAFVHPDGEVSLVATADDGLYFAPRQVAGLLDNSDGTGALAPELIPEPSVPIRSLALERTPLGTGTDDAGVINRARGYLVTSRNVYEWKFGGSPARWTSRPLNVAAGEPAEVWFDTDRSALGRVGYSDGRIFTLPGGYQLAPSLPGDGGVVRLIDFENFGGWPVALGTSGLFVARWEATALPNDAGVKLQNRFPDGGVNRPMDWYEITLPDGSRPWMQGDTTKGKLFVRKTPLSDGRNRFELFVFSDVTVYEAGEYER